MAAAAALGLYLDRSPTSVRTRAMRSCAAMALLVRCPLRFTQPLYMHQRCEMRCESDG